MNFLASSEFLTAAACILGGLAAGWWLAGWQSRREHRRAMRTRQPIVLRMEWRGFDRPEQPWEQITCDRRHEPISSPAEVPRKG